MWRRRLIAPGCARSFNASFQMNSAHILSHDIVATTNGLRRGFAWLARAHVLHALQRNLAVTPSETLKKSSTSRTAAAFFLLCGCIVRR